MIMKINVLKILDFWYIKSHTAKVSGELRPLDSLF